MSSNVVKTTTLLIGTFRVVSRIMNIDCYAFRTTMTTTFSDLSLKHTSRPFDRTKHHKRSRGEKLRLKRRRACRLSTQTSSERCSRRKHARGGCPRDRLRHPAYSCCIHELLSDMHNHLESTHSLLLAGVQTIDADASVVKAPGTLYVTAVELENTRVVCR